MFLNTLMWCVYGALTDSLPVYLPNAFGAVLSLYFLLVFHSLSPRKTFLLGHLLPAMAFLLVVSAVVSFTELDAATKRDVAGISAIVILFGAMATPLTVMGRVVAARSCESMSLPVAIFSLLNSALWCTYGILTDDLYVTIPNGVLTVTSLCQVLLFAVFDREAFTPRRLAEEARRFWAPAARVAARVTPDPTTGYPLDGKPHLHDHHHHTLSDIKQLPGSGQDPFTPHPVTNPHAAPVLPVSSSEQFQGGELPPLVEGVVPLAGDVNHHRQRTLSVATYRSSVDHESDFSGNRVESQL